MRKLDVVDYTYGKRSSDDVITSLPFTENFKECRTIQQANVVIAAYTNANVKEIAETNSNLDNLIVEVESKQDELVSGENIKTINGNSILGEGDLEIEAGVSEWGDITGDIDDQTDLKNALDSKQDTLIGTETTGQNIKTINGNSVLGSGNLTITAGSPEWGDITGDIDDQTDLANVLSGKQDTLIGIGVGQNIKTINNNSILGSGNINVQDVSGWTPAGSSYLITFDHYDSSNKLLYLNVNIDSSGFLSVGTKLRIENDNTFIYGIIIELSANSITMYIGTQNYIIGSLTPTFDYSYVELPQNFPNYMSSLEKLYLPIEIVVGIVNGKPVYRQYLSILNLTYGSWQDTGVTISNLDEIVRIEAVAKRKPSSITWFFNAGSTSEAALDPIYNTGIRTEDGKIQYLANNSGYGVIGFNVIIEYTKTTD